jgi:RES domain
MAVEFPPADLECPDPAGCPVPAALPRLRTVTVAAGTPWYRVYNATWGYDEPNPGFGDARFSPVDDPVTAARLPSIYLAASPMGALLETVFHDVHHLSARTIYERDLRGKLLAHVCTPAAATLCDLRDPALQRLGVGRDAVVSTSAEHYPCTRRLAVAALSEPRRAGVHGLIWHSRQAELAESPSVESMVLFGRPRYHQRRGSWAMFGPGATSLYDGPGRLLVEEIAENLGAIIELDS